MEIKKTREGDAVVAVASGRVDSLSAPAFERALKEIVNGPERVTVDFAGVDYISSAGLRALLSVHKYLAKRGGLTLRAVTPPVMEVLAMTGFDGILSIE